MALGTGVSRLTGVGRILVLAYALGFSHLADAYNLANTTPNMLYDIVLGGVLSATFIPVFVDRLATRAASEAWRAISSIVTLARERSRRGHRALLAACSTRDRRVHRLRPQLRACSGHAGPRASGCDQSPALVRAPGLLLRRDKPRHRPAEHPPALRRADLGSDRQQPRLHRGALVVPPGGAAIPSLSGALHQGHQLILLGLGTTAGVALQALLLVPSVARAGLGRVRFRWDPRHEAVRTVLRLGAWTFGFVVANQIALYVVLALAVGAKGSGNVSSYTYAYAFMQMPYAVRRGVGHERRHPGPLPALGTEGHRGPSGDVSPGGLRAVLSIILPSAVGMLILAKPAIALLLGHGVANASETADAGASLAILAAGLPGFCTFLYVVRALQSMQRTKVAFWLYVIENGLNIVLAVVFVHPMGVRGLAVSLSLAYGVAALLGVAVLRVWLSGLGGRRAWLPLRGSALSTLVMGVAVLIASNISGASHGLGLLTRVLGSVAVGVVAYVGTAVVMANRDRRRQRRLDRELRRPW